MDKFVERRWSNLLCIKQEEHYFICSRHCARKTFIMRKTILDDGSYPYLTEGAELVGEPGPMHSANEYIFQSSGRVLSSETRNSSYTKYKME